MTILRTHRYSQRVGSFHDDATLRKCEAGLTSGGRSLVLIP